MFTKTLHKHDKKLKLQQILAGFFSTVASIVTEQTDSEKICNEEVYQLTVSTFPISW